MLLQLGAHCVGTPVCGSEHASGHGRPLCSFPRPNTSHPPTHMPRTPADLEELMAEGTRAQGTEGVQDTSRERLVPLWAGASGAYVTGPWRPVQHPLMLPSSPHVPTAADPPHPSPCSLCLRSTRPRRRSSCGPPTRSTSRRSKCPPCNGRVWGCRRTTCSGACSLPHVRGPVRTAPRPAFFCVQPASLSTCDGRPPLQGHGGGGGGWTTERAQCRAGVVRASALAAVQVSVGEWQTSPFSHR